MINFLTTIFKGSVYSFLEVHILRENSMVDCMQNDIFFSFYGVSIPGSHRDGAW